MAMADAPANNIATTVDARDAVGMAWAPVQVAEHFVPGGCPVSRPL
jgi:hypothetical protein